MPKVSILVPIYNVEPYIHECLDSIVNQTLQELEILLLDDGSKDNCPAICDEYAAKDKRIKVIHKQNSGYGATMNIGLDNATGEYIGIVEPDDFVPLDMYETLYRKAKELDLDLIKADFYRFTGTKKHLHKIYNHLDTGKKHYNKILNPSRDLFCFYFIMNTWSGIYKREFIEKYHIRHSETPGASFQDNGFWFKTFMHATKAYFLNKPFYMNRRDNPNSSVKSKEKVMCIKEEYDLLYAYLEQHPDLKEHFVKIYQIKRFHNYMFNYNRIDDSFKPLWLDIFKEDFKQAYAKGEIDESLWSETDKEKLHLIVNNPYEFYHQTCSPKNNAFTAMILNRRKIRLTYYGYKLLAKITFGEMRKHYKEKQKLYHEKIRKIRSYFKQ